MNPKTRIESRRHPIKYYGVLAIGCFFLIGLGSLILLASIEMYRKDQLSGAAFIVPLLAIGLYVLAFSTVHIYAKNAPKVILDRNSIKIGKQTFTLKEIKEVLLGGKKSLRIFIKFPMEGMTVILPNGKAIFLFDELYSNSWEIKSFLEQTIIKKQEYQLLEHLTVKKSAIQLERQTVFKDNPFTSFRGLALYGIIGFVAIFVFLSGDSISTGFAIFLLLFGAIWFALGSWFMHYFALTQNYLIVRNHNFIWMTRIYRLTDIREIVFESNGVQPHSLRIIFTNYQHKLYPAGTLRKSTWLEMKDKLEATGVPVRNECVF